MPVTSRRTQFELVAMADLLSDLGRRSRIQPQQLRRDCCPPPRPGRPAGLPGSRCSSGREVVVLAAELVDMRRRGPEPPWAGPEIELKPGMAREMLRELAPLLAEEGIHVDEHGELSDVEVPSPPASPGPARPAPNSPS